MAVCHENSSSVFTSRSSPTNFNVTPFGYPTQTNGYGQEYGQYETMPQVSYQQPPWAGMYGSTPRAAQTSLQDWTQNYMVPVTSSLQQPYNYAYRPPVSVNMGVDYSQCVVGHGNSPLNGSPPLTSSSGENSPIISGISASKGPYEWMKPAQVQPLNGKTRTKDKYRVVYTDHQRLELEKEFHFSKYITIRHKTQISTRLQLSERQVKIWFQNRRAKERKQKKGNDVDSSLSSKLEYDEPVSPPVNNIDLQLHQHNQHPSYQHQHPHSHSPSPVLSPPSSLPQLMVKSELSTVASSTSILRSMPYQ